MKKALFILALIVIIYLLARANKPVGPNRSKYGFITDDLPATNMGAAQINGVAALPTIQGAWVPVV